MVIAGSIVFIGYRAMKEGLVYQMTVAEKIDGKKVDSSVFVYKNANSKYQISVPSNWGIAEGEPDDVFESRVEFTPPFGELKVSSISIDVVKKVKILADLYSDEDFRKWDEVGIDIDVRGTIKLGEAEVSGKKVLILGDLNKVGDSLTDNSWSLLGWFRKNGRNFYVRMFGKQNVEENDKLVFRYLLNTMEVE